jgi:hypothetical protein
MRDIILSKLLERFPKILSVDGKTNSNILKIHVDEILNIISPYFEKLQGEYKVSMKVQMLFHNTDINSNKCEMCENNTPFDTMTRKFKTFCCIKCSGAKGSSKYEKMKNTNMIRYGVTTNLVLESARNGMIAKYGGIGSGSQLIKDKIAKTNMEKYGVTNVFQNEDIKQKIKKIHEEKYNGRLYSQQHMSDDTIYKLNNYDYCKSICDDKTKTFSQYSYELGVTPTTLLKYIRNFEDLNIERKPISILEICIGEMLDKNSISYLSNNRNIISSELDIYMPDKKVAIEINGLYWHSETVNPNNKHILDKYTECKNNGIHLLTFFEHEITEKYEIVESMILNKMGKSKKVYARKLNIVKLTNSEKNIFFSKNHISGDSASSINYGLCDETGIIFAAISFSKSRFSKSEDYEIVRFANLLNHTVIGGFSKLFKYSVNNHKINSCVSYADKRFSYSGNVYEMNNFRFAQHTSPSYFYFKSDWKETYKFLSRYQAQKHKLHKILPIFCNELSEYENMKNNGWHRIWDCGNYKFVWNREAE